MSAVSNTRFLSMIAPPAENHFTVGLPLRGELNCATGCATDFALLRVKVRCGTFRAKAKPAD
jgi:hypothetical protein